MRDFRIEDLIFRSKMTVFIQPRSFLMKITIGTSEFDRNDILHSSCGMQRIAEYVEVAQSVR